MHSSVLGDEQQVEYLDVEDLIALATTLRGRPPPIRDAGLLGSAAARPQTTIAGEDAYPDIWQKAGALLQSILKNHALVDANLRLGWLATAVFLELNGVAATAASNDDVYALVIDVASEDRTLEEIATLLRRLVSGP